MKNSHKGHGGREGHKGKILGFCLLSYSEAQD